MNEIETPEQLAITFFNESMFAATGESDRSTIIIDLEPHQMDLIYKMMKKGRAIIAITTVEKP